MKKIEKIMSTILLLLQCITVEQVAKFTTPCTFIAIVIMIIVIDIILFNIDS